MYLMQYNPALLREGLFHLKILRMDLLSKPLISSQTAYVATLMSLSAAKPTLASIITYLDIFRQNP